MLQTAHWSATGPNRLRDYTLEFALTGTISENFRCALLRATSPAQVDWATLRAAFTIWKNVDLATPTNYGTYHLNHDPRDGSANIEIGALCMGGEGVSCAGSWGRYPFTIAHAWMMAGIMARVAQIKGIDIGGSFSTDIEPETLQNGPIFNVSTHGERALQTVDRDAENKPYKRPELGYFAYSGDPDCRWDLAVLDYSDAHLLATPDGARAAAVHSAAALRSWAHQIKAAGISDLWRLDGGVTP